MAEYKSFHYLMHQVPDAVKPVYVTGPAPLQFHEIYTPRNEIKNIYKGEKSFWRTRDRIEFMFFEDRNNKVMIVTSRNIDSNETYRTIFLNLSLLYFELESKARGDREQLTKKKDKKLDDIGITKAATDYILSRLNIVADPLPWPTFDSNGFIVLENEVNNNNVVPPITDNTTNNTTIVTTTVVSSESPPIIVTESVHKERMITFSKLTNDLSNLEICKPTTMSLESIDITLIKLNPIIPIVEQLKPDENNINLIVQVSSDVNNINIQPVENKNTVNNSNNNVSTTDKTKQNVNTTKTNNNNNNTKAKPAMTNGKTVTSNKSNNNNKIAPSG